MISNFVNFTDAIDLQIRQLKMYGGEVDTGHWQGVSTAGKPDLVTLELMDVAFRVSMDQHNPNPIKDFWALDELRAQIKPNLPWADDHFEERVSRVPSNPGVTFQEWPWWRGQYAATASAYVGEPTHMVEDAFKFSHTYQERFWPKRVRPDPVYPDLYPPIKGIRYEYGDLDDVVNLLLREPYTRQAYLPIFFPEDTGAAHRGRIPCTLGYHFLLRNDSLHLWYDIRSCDAVRHFRDDLYLAARLALWVIEECRLHEVELVDPVWQYVRPGILTFHAHSFHVNKGDLHLL